MIIACETAIVLILLAIVFFFGDILGTELFPAVMFLTVFNGIIGIIYGVCIMLKREERKRKIIAAAVICICAAAIAAVIILDMNNASVCFEDIFRKYCDLRAH